MSDRLGRRAVRAGVLSGGCAPEPGGPDPHLKRVRLVIAALCATGCVGGVSPAQCAIDADCASLAFCSQGACIEGTRTCPVLQPTFSSINTHFLQVGCGVGQINCHSASSPSVNSGPSFAGHPWATLVDAPAANRLGTARGLVLVKPGDPASSFLITKLRLTSALDPAYGSGQPASAPGSTCAEALATIVQWIQSGALDN